MKDSTPSLGLLIHDAARALRKRFELQARDFGLSSAQWRLMVHLVKGGPQPQARLAELLEIEPISVSRLIDRMEQGNWVERRADPGDRRVRLVHPTENAMNVFSGISAIAGEIYETALTGLSSSEQETLVRGLQAIVSNLGDSDDRCGTEAPEPSKGTK